MERNSIIEDLKTKLVESYNRFMLSEENHAQSKLLTDSLLQNLQLVKQQNNELIAALNEKITKQKKEIILQ